MADKTFTTADVAKHKDADNGLWIIIENDVYDVTSECRRFHPRSGN
jgi:cytochrome b involved in lipid metabolism